MTSRNPKWLHLALALSLAGPGAALAAELNGRIDGRLLEAGSKQPLPGVAVTLTSPSLIGGAKTVATAPDGYFLAADLPPGEYIVEFKLEGIKPIKRKLLVRQGETSPLNVQWNVESDFVGDILVEEPEFTPTRPESTQSGAVLSASGQSKIASARSYQAVAQQVAGVSGGANPDVRGANAYMNRYLVDGLDITDPVTNTFSANMNFDSVSSFAILTGGMEAQYNSMGAVINLISTQGSDEFHADASFYGNHYKLSAPAQFGSNLYEGYKPFDPTIRPPTQSAQVNLNVSGPILKEKLWYALSYQYQNSQSSVPAGPPLNLQAPNRVFIGNLLRGKINWAPGARSRVTLSASGDPAAIAFADNSGSTANLATPFASRQQNQGGEQGNLTWEYFPTDDITYKAMLGAQVNTLEVGPQGKLGSFDLDAIRKAYDDPSATYDYDRPRHTNNDDGSIWYNYNRYIVDQRYTLSTDLSVVKRAVLGGQRHEFQAGFQGRIIQRRYSFEQPGGRVYTDQGGGAGMGGLCLDETVGTGCYLITETPKYQTIERGMGYGLYVQDRWKLLDWVTIMPGLRLDHGITKDSSGRIVGQLVGLGPRLGAVLDLTRDQKTIFSAFYGRSNETLSLLATANASPGAITNYYLYKAATKTFEYDSSSGGPGGTVVDTDPKTKHVPPHADELLLSLRRQVAKGTSLGLEYTYKKLSNIWDNVEINQIWDPTGTRIIGYVNDNPSPVYKVSRPDANWIKYQSVDLILDGRPTPELEFYAAYTLSFRYGPGIEELGQLGTGISQFANPRQTQFYTGYALGDTRHQIKLQGSYTWKGLSIGPGISYATGTPLAKRYQTYSTTLTGYPLHSPVGTTPGTANDPTQISEFRLPDTLLVNARVSYDFSELTGQKITLIADGFNLFNVATATALRGDDVVATPNTFGLVSARQQPLRVQLGLRYQY